jgi:membrane protein DedA with SNARE-associated domain
MSLVDELIGTVGRNPNATGMALIGLSAFMEYVFPPFPGDAVTVFAAFLVARRGWPAAPVLAAVILGSAAGSMFAYAVGRLIARSEARWHGWLVRVRPRLDQILARFARHGALYLAINRFLPSLRALFFLAAGMARLPALKVLAFGLVSQLAWTCLLFAIGTTVGSEWSRVERIFETYGEGAWLALGLVVLGLAVRWLWRRRRTQSPSSAR